jgi:hypothetical protein
MGINFEIQHANLVAYLTAPRGAPAPSAEWQTVEGFLRVLSEGTTLISGGVDWPRTIRAHSQSALEAMSNISDTLVRERQASERLSLPLVIPSDAIALLFREMKPWFNNFGLFALIMASDHNSRAAHQAYEEIGYTSGALALLPYIGQSREPLAVLDPFPALQALGRSPGELPMIVFWDKRGNCCALPIKDGLVLFQRALRASLRQGDDNQTSEILAEAANKQTAVSILHVSDLHIGTIEADTRARWLIEHLKVVIPAVDRVVITGDLTDSPTDVQRHAFDRFRDELSSVARKDILVIPGNHDVRSRGNAIGLFGRRSALAIDLGMKPFEVDHAAQIVFISFNSCETGNFARGKISKRQLLDRGTDLDRFSRSNPDKAHYVKIVLLHHHPVPYGSLPTSTLERVLHWAFGSDEHFLELENSAEFITWCEMREVATILHGHKHTPHMIKNITRANKELTIVGCGSTLGIGDRPMCYDIVTVDPASRRSNVEFYHDPSCNGGGFRLHTLALDLRH